MSNSLIGFIKTSLKEIHPWKNIKTLHTNISADILSGIKAYSIELCRNNKEIFDKNTYNTGLAINALKKKEKFCIVPIKINFLRTQSRIGREFSINLKILKIMFLEITQDLKSLLKKVICK